MDKGISPISSRKTVPPEADSRRPMRVAVAGLGSLAVGGEVAADIYHPSRSVKEAQIPCEIVEKEYKEVCAPGGGVERVAVPAEERFKPLLSGDEIHRLSGLGLIIETSVGTPQDIEWAMIEDRVMHNDNSPKIMAQAFIDGKYSLEGVDLE